MLAAQLDDPSLEAELIGAFVRFPRVTGARRLARALADEVLQLSARIGDPVRYARVLNEVGWELMRAGRLTAALAASDAALASGKVTSSTPVALAHLLQLRGIMLKALGRLAEARATLDRAAQLVADGRPMMLVLQIEWSCIDELATSGFPAGSLARIARFVAHADSAGVNNARADARGYLAEAHLLDGRPDAALEAIDAALAIASETGLPVDAGWERVRARALLARGDVGAAMDLIERRLAMRESHPEVVIARAAVLIAADAIGEQTRIEASLNAAADIAEFIAQPGTQALVHTERAHLARALGDAAGWERELRKALRIYTQMDATGWMERIEQELA